MVGYFARTSMKIIVATILSLYVGIPSHQMILLMIFV